MKINKYPLAYTYEQLQGKDLVAHKDGYLEYENTQFCKKGETYEVITLEEDYLEFMDGTNTKHGLDLYDVGKYFYPVDKVKNTLYNPVKNISQEKYRRCVKRLSTKLFRSNRNGSCLWMHLSKCGKYYYWCEYNSKNDIIYFRGEVDWVESNYDYYEHDGQVYKDGVIVSFDSDGFVVEDCKSTYVSNSTQLKEEVMKDLTQPKIECTDKPSPIKSDGGKSDYYKIVLPEWVLKKHSEKGFIMLEDLAEAMFKNDFNFTNVFKAQKRMFELREGGGKEGNDFNYDATKCKYYIDKQVEVESRK